MNTDDTLTRLVAQAAEEGGDFVTLRAVVEEASRMGAQHMLARLGLDDETASEDLSELRQLLKAWRDAKASAWRAAVDWTVRGLLAMLLVGMAMRLGAAELLQ